MTEEIKQIKEESKQVIIENLNPSVNFIQVGDVIISSFDSKISELKDIVISLFSDKKITEYLLDFSNKKMLSKIKESYLG